MMLRALLWVVTVAAIAGCKSDTKQAMAPEVQAMASLIATNHTGETISRLRSAALNNHRYQVLYKPLAVMIATGQRVAPTKENIEKYSELYDGFLYLDLKIEDREIRGDLLKALSETPADFEDLVKYCSFGIARDLQIVINDADTVPCSNSLFERTYGMQQGLTFVTAFEKPSTDLRSLTFILYDRILNNGPLKFRFDQEQLQEPQIP